MPQDLPPLLQVREMKHSDIPSTAELLTLAPDDGALYQFPHIQQFPDDMWSLHARELRRMLLIRTLLIRIAFVPVGSEGWERIVGFIVWSRRVERGEKSVDGYFCGLEEWRDGDLVDALESILRFGESKYRRLYDVLHPPSHPALEAHPERKKGLSRIRSDESHRPLKDIPSYTLEGLAVNPKYQGCGIGSLLVNWGKDQAAKESVPIFVGGEERGVLFYENACGFRRIPETEWWLDSHGEDITRESVMDGNEAWKTENGGCSGCTLIYDSHVKK